MERKAPATAAPAKGAKTEAKKKGTSEAGVKTPAQLVHELLKKDKGVNFQSEIVLDPDAPIATAKHWIAMPHPWQRLTGVQGIPLGHVTTIQGKPDGGKTTIAMHAMVEAQDQGYNVVLIDTEHKFNRKRLGQMGADLKDILFLHCETIEDGFTAIETTMEQYEKITKGKPILFVWDSLGGTPTNEEMRKGADDITVASAAKVIKRNLRRMVAKISRKDVGILFINQVYDNINAMFGNSTKGYGGNGAYFASVLVVEVQRIRAKEKQIGGVKRVVGLISGMKCTKNHLSEVQGGKAQILIGPTGIDQDSVQDLNGKDDDPIAAKDEDEDMDFEVKPFQGKARARTL